LSTKAIEVDLFPIKCFELNIPEHEQILQECLKNREQIKEVNAAAGKTWHENHFSDFPNTIKNEAFEGAVKKVLSALHNDTGLSVGLTEYWTAFYGEGAMHEPHVHNVSVFDKINYSGVLYLTEGSGTVFFSPHSMGENNFTTKGSPGNLFIFPAAIPHAFHNIRSGGKERVIISFNLHLYGEMND